MSSDEEYDRELAWRERAREERRAMKDDLNGNDGDSSLPANIARSVMLVDRLLLNVVRMRMKADEEVGIRLHLSNLERVGLWWRDAIPERARRTAENMMIVTGTLTKTLSRQETVAAQRTVFYTARAVAQTYENAGSPGVLQALDVLERCFTETDRGLVLAASNPALVDAAFALVAALKAQDVKTLDEGGESNNA